MHKCDLISSHVKGRSSKPMQLLDEDSEVYFNFINSLHSHSTKKIYKFCLEKFLNHYRIEYCSLLPMNINLKY